MELNGDSSKQDDVQMLLTYQVRALKNKVWRMEQQLSRAVEAQAASDKKLEKFKDVSDDILERVYVEIKKEELEAIKKSARDIIDLAQWIKASREEPSYMSIDEKIKYWNTVIQTSKCAEESDHDDKVE